jgi:hypothetical protein
MQISLKMEDHLYNDYLTRYGSPMHYKKMKDAIDAFKDIEGRYLILHGAGRQALERIFQTTIDDVTKLEQLIKNLCSVKIDQVEIQFTADQLARLDMQAKFFGKSTEDFIKQTIEELIRRFMEEA